MSPIRPGAGDLPDSETRRTQSQFSPTQDKHKGFCINRLEGKKRDPAQGKTKPNRPNSVGSMPMRTCETTPYGVITNEIDDGGVVQ